ncbi:MAG: hypothetical protein JW843_02830 [Candidatus Aminicenantes bacterium]|nr:hypothetical protein [Candidatus Aminicenantes bacterium]
MMIWIKGKTKIKRFVILIPAAFGLWIAAAALLPDFRVEVTIRSQGEVEVRATIHLDGRPVYIKDAGRGTEIRWLVGGKDVPFQTRREGDALYFSGLPASGAARLFYKIRAFSSYINSGDRLKLREAILISPSGFLALTGFFPGIEGSEHEPIDIRWRLPRRWTMISGQSSVQPLHRARERMWVAARPDRQGRAEIGGASFTVSVPEGAILWGGSRFLDGLTAYFRHAWEKFGPLEKADFEAFLLPRALLAGFVLSSRAIAVSDEFGESIDRLTHEMLHWWSGYRVPYWIREGLIAYLSRKIRVACGLDGEAIFRQHLQSCLTAVRESIKKSGKATPLAEMSDMISPNARFKDLHALGTLVARRLDLDIQAQNPKKSLFDVFAAMARNRNRNFDLRDLVEQETGFRAKPFFEKYVFGKIENPENLLK